MYIVHCVCPYICRSVFICEKNRKNVHNYIPERFIEFVFLPSLKKIYIDIHGDYSNLISSHITKLRGFAGLFNCPRTFLEKPTFLPTLISLLFLVAKLLYKY